MYSSAVATHRCLCSLVRQCPRRPRRLPLIRAAPHKLLRPLLEVEEVVVVAVAAPRPRRQPHVVSQTFQLASLR